ncbi:MAG: cyclopropane-fatty-acyl-phospholipid synthase family protein [Pirellulaceae bacterium]
MKRARKMDEATNRETIQGDLYDYPRYYDLVFGSDWKAEFRFLTQCFSKHSRATVRRVFEPACGTGRLMYRLAKAGYEVSGLDLNPHAVEYCNARLARHGFSGSAFIADMTDFQLPRPVDAAFNTINSFRHLTTERAAQEHLECVARSLRRGGLYILGLHLTPTKVPPTDEESWSARRGSLVVNTRLWTTERDSRRRQERFRMNYDVFTPTKAFRITDEMVFRTYTLTQFRRLLSRIASLELIEAYDFSYDIGRAALLGGETEDVVFVLGKK